MTTRAVSPPARILAAFGAGGPLTPLLGGRGTAWRAGAIVVKPAEASELMLAWQSQALSEIGDDRTRLALPRASRSGTFIVDGWSASTFCVGAHDQRRWPDIIAVGEVLHAQLANIECPDVLLGRDDPWSIADRAAWGDIPLSPYLNVPHVARLAGRLEPVQAHAQLIHGDLTGNVLFDDPHPPAVIDLSLYWRPAAYATAIVVADALVWEGAAPSDFDRIIKSTGFGQFLARALTFRIITDWIVDPRVAARLGSAYAAVADLAFVAISHLCVKNGW